MRVMVPQFRNKAMDFVIINLLQIKTADSAHMGSVTGSCLNFHRDLEMKLSLTSQPLHSKNAQLTVSTTVRNPVT